MADSKTFSDGLGGVRATRVDRSSRNPRYDTPNGLNNNIEGKGRRFLISSGDAPEVRYQQLVPGVMEWNLCAICHVPLARCKHAPPEEESVELHEDDFTKMPGWTAQVSKATFDPDEPIIDLT